MKSDLILSICRDASNDIAIAWCIGVVMCREHYAQGGATIPLQLHFIERAINSMIECIHEIAA